MKYGKICHVPHPRRTSWRVADPPLDLSVPEPPRHPGPSVGTEGNREGPGSEGGRVGPGDLERGWPARAARPGQEWAGDERAACPGDMSSWLLEPRSRPTAWFLQV